MDEILCQNNQITNNIHGINECNFYSVNNDIHAFMNVSRLVTDELVSYV